MTMTRSTGIVFCAVTLAVSRLCAANEAESDRCRPDRMLLVLQCGSDWCESGDDVRRVFEGSEFRRRLGGSYEFAVYDDMDAPPPEVAAANRLLADLRIESKRFPAVTCLTRAPRRFFAQLENIPFDVTAKDLASRIAAAAKIKDRAVALFSEAARGGSDSKRADSYGRAFDLLTAQVGDFNGKSLREGKLAWADEWKALVGIDRDDRFGWKFRFEAGTGIDLVEKATKFRTSGDFAGGERFIESLRRIPPKHFTVEQKQVVDIAEYALWRKDDARMEENRRLLRRALAQGRDTVWGQCALGYLILSGEKHEKAQRRRAPVRSRRGKALPSMPQFYLSEIEKSAAHIGVESDFSEGQKLAIARLAVMRRIGKEGWDALKSRPGAGRFVRAFFSDRKWMEDFAWSGKCENWPKAILALESVVFQDDKRWVGLDDCAGRRFATALSLALPTCEEHVLADIADAYRTTALSKRLHKSAKTQAVWLWRMALSHLTGHSYPASVEKGYDYQNEVAEQQRILDRYYNTPLAKYANACWLVPWRNDNCFGEWVQRSFYYEPWRAADEWILRRYTPVVGGVCGELSKFGSACGNAHGLPSFPVGQPRHCALTRRLPNGNWEINYNVARGTGFGCSLMPFRRSDSYTYSQVHEDTFEGDRERRLNADRILELAFLSERNSSPDAASLYSKACTAWKRHYIAWRSRGDWIVRAKRPIGEHRGFVDDCVVALKGLRQPLWDILSKYFERVAKERGLSALADEIARVMPALRQDDVRMGEEGFFDRALADWTKPLGNDASLIERVAAAAFKAQYGTRDYFSQTVSWSIGFASKDESLFSRFAGLLGGFSRMENGGEKSKADFGSLILSSSRAGNAAVYRQAVELQKRFSVPEVTGDPYPRRDFGGELVSSDGMLRTSSTSVWESPGQYAFALDETPLRGNAFHTDKERRPWAMVVLAGPCRVRGVLAVNKAPGSCYRSRQPPVEVQLSEDGENWETVFKDVENRDVYRVDLTSRPARAVYVRVRRTPDAKDEVFHLNKILVYGERLY